MFNELGYRSRIHRDDLRFVLQLAWRLRMARRGLRRMRALPDVPPEVLGEYRGCVNEAWNSLQSAKRLMRVEWVKPLLKQYLTVITTDVGGVEAELPSSSKHRIAILKVVREFHLNLLVMELKRFADGTIAAQVPNMDDGSYNWSAGVGMAKRDKEQSLITAMIEAMEPAFVEFPDLMKVYIRSSIKPPKSADVNPVQPRTTHLSPTMAKFVGIDLKPLTYRERIDRLIGNPADESTRYALERIYNDIQVDAWASDRGFTEEQQALMVEITGLINQIDTVLKGE